MCSPEGTPLPLGIEIRKLLEDRGVEVAPTLDLAAHNRLDKIADGIDRCDVFVVFGTENYGENTGNPICSHEEFEFAKSESKSIAHIKMCPKFKTANIRMRLMSTIWKDQSEGAETLCDWIIALCNK